MLLLESEYIQLEYQLVLKFIKPLYKQLNQTNLVLPFSPPPVTVDFYRSLTGIKQKLLLKGLHVKFIKPTAKGMFVTISWNSRPIFVKKTTQSVESPDKVPSSPCITITPPLSQKDAIETPQNEIMTDETITKSESQETSQNEITTEETVTKMQEFRLDNEDDRCRLRLHYLQMRARELGCGD